MEKEPEFDNLEYSQSVKIIKDIKMYRFIASTVSSLNEE